MKQRIAYILTIVLLVLGNIAQMNANGEYASAKRRVATLLTSHDLPQDHTAIIETDGVRTEHRHLAGVWGRVGFYSTCLGLITLSLAMLRKEKAWYSMPLLLLALYVMLITAS